MKEALSIVDTLKLALEALDMMVVPRGFQAQVRIKEIYDTIEEALAQSEQSTTCGEPVAYLHQCGKKPELKELSFKKNEPSLFAKGYKSIPLVYTTPPQPKEPEQEPVAEARYDGTLHWIEPHGVGLHRIQGPLYTIPPQHVLMAEHWKSMYEQLKASAYTPDDGALTEEQINQLRKTAPQRPWVGLTHEDIDKAIEDNQRFGGFRKVGFAYDVESLLKEKNI